MLTSPRPAAPFGLLLNDVVAGAENLTKPDIAGPRGLSKPVIAAGFPDALQRSEQIARWIELERLME
jgi:hypothetical protein